MTIYRLGDHGQPVAAIQQALQQQRYYKGPIDGSFGGGTQAAVKAFQAARQIDSDGQVGEETWSRLFPLGSQPFPANPLLARPLEDRCLALTGSFETGCGYPDCFAGLSGDFDGQGLSLGVAQWNFGQQSLQPLFLDALQKCPQAMAGAFHDHLDILEAVLGESHDQQMAFIRSIQDARTHRLQEPWLGMFKALCRTAEFQDIQLAHAARRMDQAKQLMQGFGLASQRALALMFDIVVQNGGIGATTAAYIRADMAALPAGLPAADREVACLRSIALRRAQAAKPEWADDVRTRKLCIAEGKGRVHGIDYDLEAQFGLSLAPA